MNQEVNDKNEIDLQQLSNSIKRRMDNTLQIIPRTISFIKKNILLIIVLLILGVVLGYVVDKYKKNYESNIIALPNFGTVDYLYEKVSLLNSKIGQNEVDFLKKVNITPEEKITKVEIEPLPNLYEFISQDENYYNVFKTLSENTDATKVVENLSTSKNFKNHLITISSKEKINQNTLESIMQFINSSKYYSDIRKDIIANVKNKMVVNDSTIKQIDAILNSVPKEGSSSSTIFLNENSQLKDLVEQKVDLVQENHELKVHLHNLDYIVTPLDYSDNLENNTGLNGKYKYILPIILVGLFFVISLLRRIS